MINQLKKMALLGAMALAPALAQDTTFGKVGPFLIQKVAIGGKFDRCAATLEPGPSMLRIAFNSKREYTFSIPAGPKTPGPLTMQIDLGKGAKLSYPAGTDGKRTWVIVPLADVTKIMDIKKTITVKAGSSQNSWQIGNIDLVDVFAKMEDCTNKAVGWR